MSALVSKLTNNQGTHFNTVPLRSSRPYKVCLLRNNNYLFNIFPVSVSDLLAEVVVFNCLSYPPIPIEKTITPSSFSLLA